MLARRAAAKVGARNDEDLGIAVRLLVEDKFGSLLAVVVVPKAVEEGRSEAAAQDGLEKTGRDDLYIDLPSVLSLRPKSYSPSEDHTASVSTFAL
jgi:hypothetical protein